MTVVDILVLFMVGCIFYAGFWCGDRYHTLRDFIAAGKKALLDMLSNKA